MTTQIRDISDFVRIIKDQPEWADMVRGVLLGQDLLELPQKFDAFVKVQTDLNRQMAEAIQKNTEAILLANIRLDRLEADVADLKTRVSAIETHVESLDARVARLEPQVGRLVGSDLEFRISRNIRNLAVNKLNLRRPRVLKSWRVDLDSATSDMLEDAEEQNIISADDLSRIEETDAIISARRKSDGADVYVLVEISRGIRDRDITRAADSATIMQKVTGVPSLPLVVGVHIAPPQAALAEEKGVEYRIVPED